MEEIGKRLVEVEIILRKLDEQYINKIPQEIWEYIENYFLGIVPEEVISLRDQLSK